MADEAGEDGGQAMPSSVQNNIGGGSPHCYLGAAAVCRATSRKGSVTLFSLVFLCLIFILQYRLVSNAVLHSVFLWHLKTSNIFKLYHYGLLPFCVTNKQQNKATTTKKV